VSHDQNRAYRAVHDIFKNLAALGGKLLDGINNPITHHDNFDFKNVFIK
jgi:hypothetical protein